MSGFTVIPQSNVPSSGFDYSFLGSLGQGLSQGYLTALQAKMAQQALMQKLALQHLFKQQDQEAKLRNRLVEQGGQPALDAYDQGTFGGMKAMQQFEDTRKAQEASKGKILEEEGPEAAMQFARNLTANNPTALPVTVPGESAIGEIGHRYGVSIPGQTMDTSPFGGLNPLKNERTQAAENLKHTRKLAEDQQAQQSAERMYAEWYKSQGLTPPAAAGVPVATQKELLNLAAQEQARKAQPLPAFDQQRNSWVTEFQALNDQPNTPGKIFGKAWVTKGQTRAEQARAKIKKMSIEDEVAARPMEEAYKIVFGAGGGQRQKGAAPVTAPQPAPAPPSTSVPSTPTRNPYEGRTGTLNGVRVINRNGQWVPLQ